MSLVKLAFDPGGSDGFSPRFLTLAFLPCLFRFFYLALQLRVFPCLLFGVKLRLLCSINLLAHQLLEHQLELSRVHSLRALADALSLKLQHHQLQLSRLAQYRIQRRNQQVDRFFRLALCGQASRRISNLPQRRR